MSTWSQLTHLQSRNIQLILGFAERNSLAECLIRETGQILVENATTNRLRPAYYASILELGMRMESLYCAPYSRIRSSIGRVRSRRHLMQTLPARIALEGFINQAHHEAGFDVDSLLSQGSAYPDIYSADFNKTLQYTLAWRIGVTFALLIQRGVSLAQFWNKETSNILPSIGVDYAIARSAIHPVIDENTRPVRLCNLSILSDDVKRYQVSQAGEIVGILRRDEVTDSRIRFLLRGKQVPPYAISGALGNHSVPWTASFD